jgi:hypothetical protein
MGNAGGMGAGGLGDMGGLGSLLGGLLGGGGMSQGTAPPQITPQDAEKLSPEEEQ